ncbi:hypothetical protein [Vibrio sp. 10N]|uniref:hypothetical protein n=1 Tax=Vibrio sp. 10N TaxID=3058938 RepID=UPI0030C65AAF
MFAALPALMLLGCGGGSNSAELKVVSRPYSDDFLQFSTQLGYDKSFVDDICYGAATTQADCTLRSDAPIVTLTRLETDTDTSLDLIYQNTEKLEMNLQTGKIVSRHFYHIQFSDPEYSVQNINIVENSAYYSGLIYEEEKLRKPLRSTLTHKISTASVYIDNRIDIDESRIEKATLLGAYRDMDESGRSNLYITQPHVYLTHDQQAIDVQQGFYHATSLWFDYRQEIEMLVYRSWN